MSYYQVYFSNLLSTGTYKEICTFYIKNKNWLGTLDFTYTTNGRIDALKWYITYNPSFYVEVLCTNADYQYILYLINNCYMGIHQYEYLFHMRLYDLINSNQAKGFFRTYPDKLVSVNVYSFSEINTITQLIGNDIKFSFSPLSSSILIKKNVNKVIELHQSGHLFERGEENNHILDLDIFMSNRIYPYVSMILNDSEWDKFIAKRTIDCKYKPISPYSTTKITYLDNVLYLNKYTVVDGLINHTYKSQFNLPHIKIQYRDITARLTVKG